MDDRLYAGLVAFWRALFLPRQPAPLPAPRVLVSVGAGRGPDEPLGELLSPPDPPAPTSTWAARPRHSKAWLACVLLGELQAGVMLRAFWEVVVRT
jgi:hypothetical protein